RDEQRETSGEARSIWREKTGLDEQRERGRLSEGNELSDRAAIGLDLTRIEGRAKGEQRESEEKAKRERSERGRSEALLFFVFLHQPLGVEKERPAHPYPPREILKRSNLRVSNGVQRQR